MTIKRAKITAPTGSLPPDIATRIEQSPSMLTAAQLAKLLNVTAKSIYEWGKNGSLPAHYIGGSVRFDPISTAKWIRDRTA